MPFKSKEQERYLQINEPEIYRDWVEKYGHFKGAESLSLNPMEVPNTISRYYMVFVDNKNIGSYLTVEEAQEVAESKNGEVIEYIADLTDAEREYVTKVNREFSQRQKTGEFFKDWWWKEESDRFSNGDDPYLRYTTTFPEENDFFDENILGEDDRRSKWISDAYGISPQMARILDSSRVFGMYMSQRDSPATIKKYRERILDAIDDYTPQSEKEAQMLKVLRPHMATRGVKGPSPSFWTTYRGWSYPKPVLNYNFDDYYDYPVPFMGYDLDKDYLVEDYGAESFEDFKRILVGDGWFGGDIGYMEGLEEYYEEYLEDFTGDNPESFEDFQERILRVDYENEDFKRIIFGAEPDTVRFKVGERYTPRYYHGYGHSDIEIIRRTDKSVFVAQVDAKGNPAGNTLRYKIHTTPAVDMGGDRFPAQEYYKLTHGQPVRAGDTTKKAESFGAEAIPIRHSRRLNGYYAIKGYEDASEDGFIYRIYRAPDTNDWFKAMVYDDNAMKDNFRKPTSRRLNPSGEMVISNDPPSLLIGAFPKLEDAKRALVFRMIQDGNYHQMITDGNLKWLLKGYYPESFGAQESGNNCDDCGGFLRECIGGIDGEPCNQAGVETRLCSKCGDGLRCSSCSKIYNYYGGDDPYCDVCHEIIGYDPISNLTYGHERWCKWDAGNGQTAMSCELCWSEPAGWSDELGYVFFDEESSYYDSDMDRLCLHCMKENEPEAYTELINQPATAKELERLGLQSSKSKKWWQFWKAESFGAEPDTIRFKVGERYTPLYYHGYGHGDIEIIRRTDKSVFVAQVDAQGNAAGNTLRYKIYTTPAVDIGGDRFPAQEYYKLTHGQPVRAGDTTKKAESFRSYKVAPDLSSYTKAELVSSIAGPQGTAAYDEVVYDPLAQSRLSAETATQRFKNYGNSLSGDTVCPACGDESWDEYSDGDEWRGYCGCGYDFDAGSALPNPLLTFYEMEALKEQGKLTSDQKEYLEWRITSTLSDLDSSSHNKKYIQDELVAHGWTLDRWGNAEPPEESVSTLVGNAESIDSFSPARLIILGASIGVALGLYNTRGE